MNVFLQFEGVLLATGDMAARKDLMLVLFATGDMAVRKDLVLI